MGRECVVVIQVISTEQLRRMLADDADFETICWKKEDKRRLTFKMHEFFHTLICDKRRQRHHLFIRLLRWSLRAKFSNE